VFRNKVSRAPGSNAYPQIASGANAPAIRFLLSNFFALPIDLFTSDLLCHPGAMKANRVEVLRDEQHKRWLIRIQVGEEVMRRHCDEAKDADEATLRRAAIQIAADEGYSVNDSDVVFV
jgi:hypothetical protein